MDVHHTIQRRSVRTTRRRRRGIRFRFRRRFGLRLGVTANPTPRRSTAKPVGARRARGARAKSCNITLLKHPRERNRALPHRIRRMWFSRARGGRNREDGVPRVKHRRLASPRTHRKRATRASGDSTRRVESSTARARVARVGARRSST